MTTLTAARFPGSLSVLGLFACSGGLQDSTQPAVDASAGPSVDIIIATGANIAGANGSHFGPDDDRLFVAQCFLGHGLYELDPQGLEEQRLISDGLGPSCGLNGMDRGPDDRLYGLRWFTGEVVRFDVDDNADRVAATGFTVPASVKFNSKRELHVLDTGTGDILKVEEGGDWVVASLSPGLDNVAFDANDRLFVSSFVDGFVSRVHSDGTQATSAVQPPSQVFNGSAAGADGRLYVTGETNRSLYRIRP